MPLTVPPSLVDYIHKEGDIVGLRFAGPTQQGYKVYYLKIVTAEFPNNLAEYSLGSASALAVAGTGYNEIEDASGNNYLESPNENELYQSWWGVTPSYARIYRQFPGGVNRGSLITDRAIGGQIGWIDGAMAPYREPSPITMMHTMKGLNAQFLGYHPRARPASITVYMYFWIARFIVERITPTPEQLAQAKVYTPGGARPLIAAPLWVEQGARG